MTKLDPNRTTGLALGSGGAKGLAHIGVIKALLEKGIKIDVITGSSAGALVGGMYAAVGNIDQVEQIFQQLTLKDLLYIFVDVGAYSGVIRGNRLKAFLDKYIQGALIENLTTKFVAVATDITTAEGVIIDQGDLVEAIRASTSAPGIFAPVEIGNQLLVDGGISQMVPVQAAKDSGAEQVIAVNLYGGGIHIDTTPHRWLGTRVSAPTVLKSSLFALCNSLAKENMRDADIAISPHIGSVMWYDLAQVNTLIQKGYEAAMAAII
jgi:NTE family protein